jgi:transposase
VREACHNRWPADRSAGDDGEEAVSVSLHPEAIGPVPEETARVTRAAFPKGNVYMRMRDAFGGLYADQAFAALVPARGQPAEAPWRLALVLVMQFAEGLPDRQAADAVRGRIDWKYALGLELTDPGFDASVLSEFRARLVAGGAEVLLLDAMLARFKDAGLLKARGRQRTDSTHVLAAIRWLNRLECVGETVRHALNALATVAPAWLRPRLDPAWAERYGPRFDEFRLPKGAAERRALAEAIGADGFRLLGAVYAADAPGWLRAVPAVETLRRVWVQEYYGPDDPPRWRAAEDLPPASRMINSPHDPEARYSLKRETSWTGYKTHLTETCDPDAPHFVVHVETTPATTPDWNLLAPIHGALAEKGLLPGEHMLDAGYVDAEGLVTSRDDHGIAVVGPVPADQSWQARAGQGFDVACFVLDWEARRATCPQGKTSVKWSATHDKRGSDVINIRFARPDCAACASRTQCTSRADGGPREMTVRPRAQHEALQAARQHQTTDAFKARYDARAGVEGTLSQGIRVCDLRRARYVGLAKVRLQHALTAAGLNLRRLGAWWDERPFAPTRRTPFLALAA